MEDAKPSMPALAKYSISLVALQAADMVNEPDPGWPKADVLVSKVEMERAFEKIKKESGRGDAKEMFRFTPGILDGEIRVFFNPSDINSLYVVAYRRETANHYFGHLGLRIPYP